MAVWVFVKTVDSEGMAKLYTSPCGSTAVSKLTISRADFSSAICAHLLDGIAADLAITLEIYFELLNLLFLKF